MKDFSDFKVNAERIGTIKEQFASGENEAQVAFQSLVQYILDELNAHKDGDKPAPRGLMAKMKTEMEISGFYEKGTLAKSYMNPSFTIANALHKGDASTCVQSIWDDFLATGDGLEGSVTRGALYTPGRLNAAWGRLNRNEDTPFRAEMEGIVAETKDGDRPWHTLNIADLKALNQRGTPDPKVASSLKRVFGNPDKLDKQPGELAKVVKGLRKDNEKLKSEVVRAVCDNLDGIIEDLRDDMSITLADAEVEAAEQRKLDLEQRRIARARNRGEAPIAEQEVLGGEVVTRDPEPAEVE